MAKKESQEKLLKVTAEELALKQREISVSEFFTKNRHLLGFDNPTRSLLTAVKEACDNSLDACQEAGVLPDIIVKLQERKEDRYLVSVEDNGPGIVKEQIPKIFGKLLYGSRFHSLKMSRGQQGIGISAVCLYSQLTTAKPMKITSKTHPNKPAHYYEIFIDTNKNEPVVTKEEVVQWNKSHGTRVEYEVEGRYIKGEKSIDEYIKQTHLANPHVKIIYYAPNGSGKFIFDRVVKNIPEDPIAIKPHPYGVELGTLIKMVQGSNAKNLSASLRKEFCRVSDRIALEVIKKARLEPGRKPKTLTPQECEALYKAFNSIKIMAPPTNCISPIGEEQIKKALMANVKAEFYTAYTRSPSVYRGNPFQIEVGIAYLIESYPQDEPCLLHRYANRVPLLYQPGSCAITKAVSQVDWKIYGLTQPKDSLPIAPMLILVHMASIWVPFTSEAKEAIAHYPEIIKDMKLALQECGRQLSIFVHKRQRAMYQAQRRSIFERYIEELSTSLENITKAEKEKLKKKLLAISKDLTGQVENEKESV